MLSQFGTDKILHEIIHIWRWCGVKICFGVSNALLSRKEKKSFVATNELYRMSDWKKIKKIAIPFYRLQNLFILRLKPSKIECTHNCFKLYCNYFLFLKKGPIMIIMIIPLFCTITFVVFVNSTENWKAPTNLIYVYMLCYI